MYMLKCLINVKCLNITGKLIHLPVYFRETYWASRACKTSLYSAQIYF